MKEITIQNYNVKFWNIATKYDTQDTNILRKIIHSYTVAQTTFEIACNLKLDQKQKQFCYLIGLFHDIGRFEQWKLYKTYNDKKSVDHGDFGAEILLNLGKDYFELTQRDFFVMVESIKYHTKQYTKGDKDVELFNKILKNADAYSNIITTANGAQQMTVEQDGVTKHIFDDFVNLKPLFVHSPKTKLDRILMLTANVYYVEFANLRQQIKNNNYIDTIYDTFCVYLNNQDKKTYSSAIKLLKEKY